MNSIKRIVVFGCSYATGEELLYNQLDDELIAVRSRVDPREFFNLIESDQFDLASDLFGFFCKEGKDKFHSEKS